VAKEGGKVNACALEFFPYDKQNIVGKGETTTSRASTRIVSKCNSNIKGVDRERMLYRKIYDSIKKLTF